MKQAVENYTFSATAKTLTFNRPAFGNNIDLTRLLLVTDVTAGVILYQFNGGGVTASGNVLTFTSLPGGVSSPDTLQILYDFPQPASSSLILPDGNLLSDDMFDNGACGWEETNVPMPTTWAAGRMPLTLGTDGNFGRYALRLTTANVASTYYGGKASAMKRMTHQAQPGVTNKGIIRAEYWFTYGSDGSQAITTGITVSAASYSQSGGVYYVTLTVSSLEYLGAGTYITVASLGGLTNCAGQAIISSVNAGASTITYPVNATPSGTYTSGGTVTLTSDLAAPQLINFEIDTQTNTDSTTGIPRTTGERAWFAAQWRQSYGNSGQPWYAGQWYLSNGTGLPYGASGYISPFDNTLFATGYYTDFCPNENKRNLHYVALVADTRNGVWLGMQANDLYYDLTSIPANGNSPLSNVLAPGDPTYNLIDFIGGCNQYAEIYNLTGGGVGTGYGTASWLELHRTRMSYL